MFDDSLCKVVLLSQQWCRNNFQRLVEDLQWQFCLTFCTLTHLNTIGMSSKPTWQKSFDGFCWGLLFGKINKKSEKDFKQNVFLWPTSTTICCLFKWVWIIDRKARKSQIQAMLQYYCYQNWRQNIVSFRHIFIWSYRFKVHYNEV